MVFCLMVFGSLLGGLAFILTLQGIQRDAMVAIVRNWHGIDGWPFLLWYVLVGPTFLGPGTVSYDITPATFSVHRLSRCDALATAGHDCVPRLIACLISWISPLEYVAAFMPITEIPVRILVAPPLTAIVVARYAFVFKRVLVTRAWDPMLPSVSFT